MKKSFIFFICYFITNLCFGQIKFTTECPSSVDINSTFRVQYTINSTDAADFVAPNFDDFILLYGPSTSVRKSYSNTNGKVSSTSTTTYTFTLEPKEKGTFKIPGASIKVNGKTYTSSQKKLSVTGDTKKNDRPAQNKTNQAIQNVNGPITNKDLYFTVTTNKKNVYEQEPIVLTYKFYAKVGVQLSNIMLKKKPDLKGFLSQEVPLNREMDPSTEEVNGHLYRVGTNLQYVLFPQHNGKLTIPSIGFDCEVIQQDTSIDFIDAFFNGVGHISRKIQRNTPELQIEVRPLPSPSPTNFSGGVGKMDVNAELLTTSLETHELCTYRVSLSGSGNLQLIKAPQIEFPKDFDVYPAKTIDETTLTTDGISGKIHFDYTFVPKNAGEYFIPSTKFVYFDSSAEKYVTLTTDSINISVKQGNKSIDEVQTFSNSINTDIKPLHTKQEQASSIEYGSIIYILLHICLLLLFVCSHIILRKYQSFSNSAKVKNKKAQKIAKKKLANAYLLINAENSLLFYTELEQAIYQYLDSKLHIETSQISKEQLKGELEKRNIAEHTLEKCIHVLENCEYARFAPPSDKSNKDALYREAMNIINEIEEY